jgi:hypothetical protein
MKLNREDTRAMIAAADTAKRNPMRPPDTLPRDRATAVRTFASHASPRLILLFVVIFGAWRLSLGGFGWKDAVVAAALVAYFPINEWLIHVFMLHYKPRTLFGRTVDFHLPRTHRHHHANPWELDWVFIPRQVHYWTPVTGALVLWLFWPVKELALTGLTAYLLLGLHYEWVHYLAHIPWCPDNAYYQRRVREHRYHHFRNENFWWGVSFGLADRGFGTAPKVEETARSGTTATVGLPK